MSETKDALEVTIQQLVAVQQQITTASATMGTAFEELLVNDTTIGQDFLEAAIHDIQAAITIITEQIESAKDESGDN